MPAQQRLRGHEETLPAGRWQSSSRGGEKYPIGKSKAGPFDLSPKDFQLMSEHDYLEILGGLVLALRNEQPEQYRTTRYTSDRSIALLSSIGESRKTKRPGHGGESSKCTLHRL